MLTISRCISLKPQVSGSKQGINEFMRSCKCSTLAVHTVGGVRQL